MHPDVAPKQRLPEREPISMWPSLLTGSVSLGYHGLESKWRGGGLGEGPGECGRARVKSTLEIRKANRKEKWIVDQEYDFTWENAIPVSSFIFLPPLLGLFLRQCGSFLEVHLKSWKFSLKLRMAIPHSVPHTHTGKSSPRGRVKYLKIHNCKNITISADHTERWSATEISSEQIFV